VIQSLIVSIITKNQCKPTYVTLLHINLHIFIEVFVYYYTFFLWLVCIL